MSRSVEKLIKAFSRMPGIGEKTAGRLTYHLLKNPAEQAYQLAEAIRELRENVVFCAVCGNITEEKLCEICRDERRDRTSICVIEEPSDIRAIEVSGAFRGLYHVLGGRLSPLDGVGPDELSCDALLERIDNSSPAVAEVIVATNPSVEGDATALYILNLLVGRGVKVSRIACGLPAGGHLEYMDSFTISQALQGRHNL
ncbi:MAG: recombination protein RecR [Candidatus Glassbacteria bacterium RIFCSPLOWO2_12_FULL_58_11]|uniref:Recombination protein RecR n=1 Tax=Candidatus Glassbacteria bacterium RIFCSPLOWO2_12_FULL_58_11 TaxID=1817867 RepID=A0A1F5YRR2_9BACT|nr:MAG: recombination protein RecR [Candidatus Glassbacteria bacterium RIFCSPLOWO2_12_FULL_58_11]